MEESKLHDLLSKMTTAEKIGQLVQLTPDYFTESGELTGPMSTWQFETEELAMLGSVLGTKSGQQVYDIQKRYLEKSRLKIPLMFMADVIHGYETIFPIPLALAGSFNPETIEKVAELSAQEASGAGIQVTFSPMVDHVRDSRWGRVMESNGEDSVLSAELTKAYIKGYQGVDLAKQETHIAACLKHFVGYGAAEGGRDYNLAELSDLSLYQNYLPAFQAGIEAGAELVMTSFNTIKGIPSTGNQMLVQNILRDELAFHGVVISDWSAVAELLTHRVAENPAAAARMAFDASVDIDMVSDCYQHYLLEQLTDEDKTKLDKAVWRILSLKNRLGLFENPYRGIRDESNQTEIRTFARKTARETIVLLKNEENILPLDSKQKIALVGHKSASHDLLGAWYCQGKIADSVPLSQGLQEKIATIKIVAPQVETKLTSVEKQAMIEAASECETVIVAVGETSQESGENKSKTNTHLSEDQVELIKELAAVNPNLILVLFNGRPLVLTDIEPYAKAIVEAWFPGSEGGRAIADILVGEFNPQAKLAMSFPRTVGQLPLSYQEFSTGRPVTDENRQEPYVTRYLDTENTPLYPFGYGLSYSEFALSELTQSANLINEAESLTLSVEIENTSQKAGTAIVQLYLEDKVTQVARPKKEFKQWQLVNLNAGEKQKMYFDITQKDLTYVHSDLTWQADSGEFTYWIGLDSLTGVSGTFTFKK